MPDVQNIQMMNNLIKLNIGLCLLFCILLIAKGIYYSKNCESSRFVAVKYGSFFSTDQRLTIASECDQQPIDTRLVPAGLDKSPEAEALILKTYESRQNTYETNKSSLKMVLIWLFFGVMLTLRIIYTRPPEIDMPIVNFKIPIYLFYVFMPIVFIYLWIQFGLNLTAAIDSRMVLEQLTDQIEVVDGKEVAYYFSNSRTLVDQGYIDFWCTYFYDVFSGGVNPEIHKRVAFSGLFLIYGTIMGLIHAVCLVLTVFISNKVLRTLLNVAILSTLAFSSYLLVTWYQHAAFLIAWIWGVAFLCLLIWFWVEREKTVTETEAPNIITT